MSERIVRQHVESKFVEDIQRLTQLVEMLKNEQKSYRNRISALEKVIFWHIPSLSFSSDYHFSSQGCATQDNKKIIISYFLPGKNVDDVYTIPVRFSFNAYSSFFNFVFVFQQLKQPCPKLMTDGFKGPSLFCSPPSTSNGQSSVLAMTELACSATSSSTAPLPSTLHCSTINEGSVDEVRNFRINEVTRFPTWVFKFFWEKYGDFNRHFSR